MKGNVIFYAKYTETPREYTVTWKNGTDVVSSQTLKYGEKITAPADNPTKDPDGQKTYTFSGWNTAEDGSGTNWTADPPTTVTGDVTYYAQYTEAATQYTITWKDGETVIATKTLGWGTDLWAAKPADPTRTDTEGQFNYTFAGWVDETGNALTESTKVEKNATYTAQWTTGTNRYVVTFNVNGGEMTDSASQEVEYGQKVTKPADPTRMGYTFAGWYGPGMTDTGTLWNFESDTVTGALTLTAQWTPIKYTITWSIDGNTETTQVNYGETPTHADPVKEGYDFVGWDPAITEVTGDQTYTAKFQDATKIDELYVDGTLVTVANKDNIPLTSAGASGTISYDPKTNTLTLDNVNLDCTQSLSSCDWNQGNSNAPVVSYAIYYRGTNTFKIKVVGNNTISNQCTAGRTITGVISAFHSVEFIGDGTLTLSTTSVTSSNTQWNYAIFAGSFENTAENPVDKGSSTLTVNGPSIKINAGTGSASWCSSCGIKISQTDAGSGYGKIIIKSGSLHAEGEKYGVCVSKVTDGAGNPLTSYRAKKNGATTWEDVTGVEAVWQSSKLQSYIGVEFNSTSTNTTSGE